MININTNELHVNSLYPYPYRVINNELHIETIKNKVTSVKKLCNFLPYIVNEVGIDDGVELVRFISISGVHENGSQLKEIKIPSSDLTGPSLGWIMENWGVKCNIEPGRNVKDYIRHAIQSTAKNIPSKTIYKHFGWKEINNKWEFLLNSEQFDVETTGKLRKYIFLSERPKESIHASYNFIDCKFAPDAITYPLLAYTYLTPLNHFLKKQGVEPKTVLCIIGKTGSKKSTLAALALSHYGNFTNIDLPLSFRDTANSIISTTFLLKDVLTVIDDYHPSTKSEELTMKSTAQTIIRAYGDRVGRERLKSDSSLMTAKPPRGNAIITGEQAPEITPSTTARTIQLFLNPNDIDNEKLSCMQSDARLGYISSAMRYYIQYIKEKKLSTAVSKCYFGSHLKESFINLREKFTNRLTKDNINFHPRLPEAAAWLTIGLEHCLDFFLEMNEIKQNEYDEHYNTGIEIFYNIILNQSIASAEENISVVFITKLQSLLASGKAIVLDKSSSIDIPKPVGFIGYEDEFYYYLISDIAHSMVKRLCIEQDEFFSPSLKSLLSHLYDDGYIDGSGSSKTKVVRIGNSTRRMMLLRKDRVVISSEEP